LVEDEIKQTIKENSLINSNEKVVIGVSGGPDSMCLLNALNKLKNEMQFEIVVAHINHMIRKEADLETKYVQQYCRKNNIECFIKKVDVIQEASKNKIGTEEAGRKVRYDFFEEVRKKTDANKIATAHNANDNAETVLMNLMRGSGISGLKGIEFVRNNIIIRPLLSCNRTEIEEYCNKEALNPKIDKSNKENDYTRNKIRNLLIPYIQKEFNPNIIESLNRLSSLAKEENNYWNKIIKIEYNKLIDKELCKSKCIVIKLKEFNGLEKVVKSKMIFYIINELLGSIQGIQKIHIEDIIKLCKNNIGNKFLIPNKKLKVLVKDKRIFFIKNA
jgi:tRNA(Ile)-lysidine synthase